MSDDLPAIHAYTTAKVTRLLAAQCLTPGDRNCGGFIFDDSGYADSRGSIYTGITLFVAYLYPEFQAWYANPELLERLRLFLDFMRRRQRPDGTVMLGCSAAPGCAEVGFTLPGVCAAYERVAASTVPGRDEMLATLRHYIARGAAACRTLRPFTANHRWTACAGPLAYVDRLFPDPANRTRIAEFLADGIDCDQDGLWFEERSPNYNQVANWGMLYLADHANHADAPQCLAAAYRNCRNNLLFIQPNGEADTTFSHRQDRGEAGREWGDWWIYKRLAVEFADGELAQAADELLRRLSPEMTPFIPLRFLLDDERMRSEKIPRKPWSVHHDLRASEQAIWRRRCGAVATTVVADHGGHFWDATYNRWGACPRSNTVLSLHHGEAIIDACKVTWGAGSGGFRPEKISYHDDGLLTLTYHDPGQDHVAHYRPRAQWDWQNLAYDQVVTMRIEPQSDSGLRLHLTVTGESDVHVNVQFLLRESSRLRLPSGETIPLSSGGRTFSAGHGDYVLIGSDDRAWRIRGLPASEHRMWTGDGSHLGGHAERRSHRLIVGGFTPFTAVITLIPEPSGAQA